MSREIIITFLIFFTPIAIIEQYKKDNFSELAIEQFNINRKSNFHLLDSLFDYNKKNSIEIKNCRRKGDLTSQKRYCSSAENFLQDF